MPSGWAPARPARDHRTVTMSAPGRPRLAHTGTRAALLRSLGALPRGGVFPPPPHQGLLQTEVPDPGRAQHRARPCAPARGLPRRRWRSRTSSAPCKDSHPRSCVEDLVARINTAATGGSFWSPSYIAGSRRRATVHCPPDYLTNQKQPDQARSPACPQGQGLHTRSPMIAGMSIDANAAQLLVWPSSSSAGSHSEPRRPRPSTSRPRPLLRRRTSLSRPSEVRLV